MFILGVKVRHFVAVFCWLLQLANCSPQQQLLQVANSSPQQQLLQTCCGVILLGSGGPAAVSLQAARLGVYRISGLLNDRPVYKHERNRGDATLPLCCVILRYGDFNMQGKQRKKRILIKM
jgi:hypothetical protein